EKQLTITITNVNETPTDITLSNNSIAENTASGSSVGTLAGIDPDAGSSFTYALVSGTGDADNVSFSLTGNTLKTNTTYSYALKNSYSIRIRATDAGGLWYEKQFLLNITEVNVAPVNISLSNNNAVENSVPGSTVGTFSTTDTNTVDSFTYTLVSGTGSDDNASFTTTGSALKLAVTPDYETKNSYKIRVRTTDSGGLFFEKEFTINITDINENPAPAPTPSPAPQTNDNRVEIIINDNTQKAATATVQEVDGKKVTTVTVDEAVIEEKLKNEPSGSTVVIPVNNNSDVVVGTLNGQTVSNMSEKEAVVEIRSERVTYTLPAAEINMDAVSEELGENVSLKDIEVSIRIAEPSQDTVRVVEDTANKNNYQIVVKPVEFEITCTNGDKTVQVQRFNGYVERTVAIPEGINPAMITTGIVLNADGTFSHVPTTVLVIDGKFYARINSLTNSTYSVIWNPRTFSDVSNHWGKADVDDIASRLIMDGISEDKFGPDAGITRAEFIDAVVRSLGLLRPGKETDRFKDVKKDNKYMASIAAAAEYGIVGGYSDGTLGPARLIAREEAMNILFRAMKVAGMDIDISDEEVKSILSNIRDRDRISKIAVKAAAVCVKYDIFRGGKAKKLTLDAKITRAQTAAIIKRMLTAANLI
ncbi:MAG: S-layer homology domain-containing protein, partial [Clostridia bacterium]|nr:S-layer homology domain-containing protein [Clostridia bacterium]